MTKTSFSLPRLPEGTLAVAVSGGVDSLCALLLCRRAGRKALAVHAKLHAPADEESLRKASATEVRLRAACQALGADFFLLEDQERFSENVIAPFAQAYREGRTPNPCALCNRRVKFGAFMEYARKLGADALVTGHYVALDHSHPYRGSAPLIGPAADKGKDQGYFLGLVPRARLARAGFPLASLEKTMVRKLVAEAGLEVPAPAESQDICFVPRTRQGYRDFLAEENKKAGFELPGSGPIIEVDSGRTLGSHTGLWQYTEGQRQGLGIAWKEALYVIGKRPSDNALLVGSKAHVFAAGAVLRELNLMVEPDEIPPVCLVRLRYRQTPVRAQVRLDRDRLSLQFENRLPLSAPGQIGVVYDSAARILAAGIIGSMV